MGDTRQNGLQPLLERDEDARRYYNALPSYVQDLVRRAPADIRTGAELRRSADTILDSLYR